MTYNVLIYNGIENAAVNSAEWIWNSTEIATHFILLPYVTYRAMNWMFHSSEAQVAPQAEGYFARAKNFFSSPLKATAKFIGAEIGSHTLNQLWLKTAFWENVKPIPVAFLRPILERLVLSHNSAWDKSNINFSLRDLVPGGQGSWFTWGAKPLLMLRNGVTSLYHTPTTAELLAPKAYELGDSFANTTQAVTQTLSEVLGSTAQIGPCLQSPTTAGQCYQTASAYLAQRAEVIYSASTPLRASFDQWCRWGWDVMSNWVQWGSDSASHYADQFLKDGVKQCASQFFNVSNAALWGVATTVEAHTKVPAHLIYYAEIGFLSYMTYKLASFSKDLAKDAIRARCIPSVIQGYFISKIHTAPQPPVGVPGPQVQASDENDNNNDDNAVNVAATP